MTIPDRLTAHLSQKHIAYDTIHHIPARSSQYAASLLHVPGRQVAKTVALRAGEKTLLAVLPASWHLNLKKFAALVAAEVSLVDEQECYQLFPDCQPGAIPPFGELYNLPVYMDQALADVPDIVFCAGTLCDGIRMGNADFIHVVKPRVCSFAEPGDPARTDAGAFAYEEGGGK